MELLRIREIIEAKGMTGKELAKAAGISRVYMSDVINNKKFPRKETLYEIAKALDVDIRELFVSTKERDFPSLEDAFEEIRRVIENMKPKKYYRVLTHKIQAKNWEQYRFNSTHGAIPGIWIDKYYKNRLRNPEDFELDFNHIGMGRLTERARENFLRIAPKYQNGNWNDEDINLASELDGVHAWESPIQAFNFFKGVEKRIREHQWVVEFTGRQTGTCPETDQGGVLVRVIKKENQWKFGEFISSFKFNESELDE